MTIRTTHVGSLPRGPELEELLVGLDQGEGIDMQALEAQVQARVDEVVARQVAAGLDIVNDGEQGRPGFQTYVAQTGHRSKSFVVFVRFGFPYGFCKFLP